MTDHHPVPAQLYTVPRQQVEPHPDLPAFGKVEFVLFGYTDPSGIVMVAGSRDVSRAQIDTELPDWDNPARHLPVQTVSATCRRLTMAQGYDMRNALANLLQGW